MMRFLLITLLKKPFLEYKNTDDPRRDGSIGQVKDRLKELEPLPPPAGYLNGGRERLVRALLALGD